MHRYYIRTVQPTRCNVSQFIYFCKTLKHVSDDFSVHHQELKTAHTASGKSDMWLTVHRNSVWIRNQLDVTFVLFLFLFYKLLNMFRATMCPSSGADECVVLSPRVGMCRGCRKAVKTGWKAVRPWMGCVTNPSMDTLTAN